MSSKAFLRVIATVFLLGLRAQPLLAASVAVGPDTCQPSLVHFATIQAAVSAVPFGATVLVCPGTYPEQVVITQPLTLKGVTDGVSGAAVIAVPAGGLVLNANSPTDFGPLTGQLVIQNTVGVNVSDIIVDGTGSGCVAGANRESGIVVTDVGTPNDGVIAAKIQNVVVRNEHGCNVGEGIVVDTSYATISANQLHDIDRTGVVVSGGKASVANNTMQAVGLNGVALLAANQATVSGNNISGVNQAGLLIQGNTTAAIFTKNIIVSSPNAVALWLVGVLNSTTTANRVSGAGWGVVLQSCAGNIVQTNVFNGLGADGIFDQNSLGGNVVTKNTVNEAAFGIFTDSTVGGDTLVPNSLYNDVVTVDPSPALLATPDM